MNTTIKLSVSSVLLAGFMTGCSQQQFQGGGQQIVGGSQLAGGGQVAGGAQVAGGQQVSGGGQVAGSQQVAGGQQVAAHDSQIHSRVMTDAHSHNLAARTDIHSHSLQSEQRVYVPLPKELEQKPPAVVMFDKPKVVAKPYVAPKKIHQPKPIVKHKGIGLPPAQPGQCFAKVKQPAKFKNTVKRVQVSPAVNKRVKVRGPQYTWVNKRVLARPATHRYQYIPAQYRTVTKKVLVKPAHYTWQKGKTGPVTRIDNMTGEILCRVKVPAVYRTVTQKVVARAAQRIKRHVPAVYKTVKEKKLSSPAQYRTINTPARFINKTYRTKVSDERYLWKPIACKAPTAQARYSQPQQQAVSAQQRQQTAAFNREQAELKKLWIQQEAQRQRDAAAKQRNIVNQQRQAQQARQQQASAAQAARQKQALAAQRQRQAKQLALVAQQQQQQQRQAKQAALVAQQQKAQQLAEKRRIAEMRKTSHTQPSYAAPKVRTVSVNSAAQAKPQPAKIQAKAKPAFVDNPNAPLTRENAVFRIQKALQQRGYNPGELDGRLGPSTVKALTAFQEAKGLKTGTLNKDTLRALSLVN